MTNFYSYVEPLSKYSPVTLHLSPATTILNENLDCRIFLIILTAGRIGKNGRRGRNVQKKRAYGQNLTGHAKRDHVGYNQSTLIGESQGGRIDRSKTIPGKKSTIGAFRNILFPDLR